MEEPRARPGRASAPAVIGRRAASCWPPSSRKAQRRPLSPLAAQPPVMANAAASYKQQKEDFVSNLAGGSVAEIALVTAVAPASRRPPQSFPLTSSG